MSGSTARHLVTDAVCYALQHARKHVGHERAAWGDEAERGRTGAALRGHSARICQSLLATWSQRHSRSTQAIPFSPIAAAPPGSASRALIRSATAATLRPGTT